MDRFLTHLRAIEDELGACGGCQHIYARQCAPKVRPRCLPAPHHLKSAYNHM